MLPPLPIPVTPDVQGLAAGRRVLVHQVRIEGNTVLDDAELAAVASPYEGRELSFAEIVQLADAVTNAYIQRGYVTSGATIPEQSLAEGVLTLRVVEGRLGRVEVESTGRFRRGYFEARRSRRSSSRVSAAASRCCACAWRRRLPGPCGSRATRRRRRSP